MSRYPIAKDFKKIDRPMPYHRLLFPLAGPVQKLMLRCVPLLEGLTVSKESIPGFQGKPVPVELYRPAGKGGKLPCVLLFHGGGFGYRAAPYHKRLAMEYARRLGCVVAFPDYHLLPRYPYPAAREDALAAYRWLHSQREALQIDGGKIIVAGDRAGARDYLRRVEPARVPPGKYLITWLALGLPTGLLRQIVRCRDRHHYRQA
mgnify:CR=1 FL=1